MSKQENLVSGVRVRNSLVLHQSETLDRAAERFVQREAVPAQIPEEWVSTGLAITPKGREALTQKRQIIVDGLIKGCEIREIVQEAKMKWNSHVQDAIDSMCDSYVSGYFEEGNGSLLLFHLERKGLLKRTPSVIIESE